MADDDLEESGEESLPDQEAEEEIQEEPTEAFPEEELAKSKFEQERRFGIRSHTSGGGLRSPSHLWLISYSDFMTILMIFFLGMYGYTYLAKYSILQKYKKQMTYSEFSKLLYQLKGNLDEQVEIQDDVHKMVLQLPSKVLFPSGEASLNPKARRTLEELAESIKLLPGDVIVEGHTDNVPITKGPYRSNWELSAARAFSVIDTLTRKGVPPRRLSAWGFGEHRPKAPNDTKTNRAKNRRIEIVFLKKKEAT